MERSLQTGASSVSHEVHEGFSPRLSGGRVHNGGTDKVPYHATLQSIYDDLRSCCLRHIGGGVWGATVVPIKEEIRDT